MYINFIFNKRMKSVHILSANQNVNVLVIVENQDMSSS